MRSTEHPTTYITLYPQTLLSRAGGAGAAGHGHEPGALCVLVQLSPSSEDAYDLQRGWWLVVSACVNSDATQTVHMTCELVIMLVRCMIRIQMM